jgi:hypothetical protein
MIMMAAAIAGAGALLRAQALSSGIGVSGHWVIQVLNADGSVASRTEFRNHLTPEGATLLGRLVARNATLGTWQIITTGSRVSGGGALGITMGEGSNPPLVLSSPSPGAIRLAGEGRPTAAVDLRDVGTTLKECSSTMTEAECVRDGRPGIVRPFSSTTLPSPIRVATNQTVQVQVDVSFSPMP